MNGLDVIGFSSLLQQKTKYNTKCLSRARLANLRMHAVTVRIRKQGIYVIKVILLDQPNTCHQSVCFTRIEEGLWGRILNYD